MSNTAPFKRSETGFFHQTRTQSAIKRLAEGEKLTIYCGAGVTIDRTAFGWGALIASIFAPDPWSHESYPTPDEIAAMGLKEDPVRLASVLTQYALDRDVDLDALKRHITPLLQNRLYKSNSWQAGRLAHNICSLALIAASGGIEVDIITTNYDTYLESGFLQEVKRLELRARDRAVPDATATLPQLRVWIQDLEPDEALGETLFSEQGVVQADGPVVNLHYLHGRVPPDGAADGVLVISEEDYARTRQATLETLTHYFAQGRRVLIVGASLTDPPLIDALALTKAPYPVGEAGAGRVKHDDRFVLMSRASLGYRDLAEEANMRIVTHLARRTELLGTRLLVPDHHFQVAQFCEEIRDCVFDESVDHFFAEESQLRYGLRLTRWWQQWRESIYATGETEIYTELNEALQSIRGFLYAATQSDLRPTPDQERFRLEIWVREDPGSVRRLTMWANTAGPILDHKARRWADIEMESSNASVRAFTEGRPQHLDAQQILGVQHARLTRWGSYFSVPIYVKPTAGGRVPVGVVTLASTASMRTSILPLAKTEHTEALRTDLITIGRRLLQIPAEAPDVPVLPAAE